MPKKFPNILSIAGIDPSGGAGLLADIKTISALNAYGCGVVTAITAQNTKAVTAIAPVATEIIEKQIDTLFTDMKIDAIKIGMLFNESAIKAVANKLKSWSMSNIVLDPVMVAKSGDSLLLKESTKALKGNLLPLATVITPNLPEAECLLNKPIGFSESAMEEACKDLWELKGGNGWIVLKGGHSTNKQTSKDYLYDGVRLKTFSSERFMTQNTHGTGCALSSAIAALIPQTKSMEECFTKAKVFISKAIKYSDQLHVGNGHGPIMHFYSQWV